MSDKPFTGMEDLARYYAERYPDTMYTRESCDSDEEFFDRAIRRVLNELRTVKQENEHMRRVLQAVVNNVAGWSEFPYVERGEDDER